MGVVLFDFFGTLVDYSPSRTEQGYAAAHDVLRANGCGLAEPDWLAVWAVVSEALDAAADSSGVEFSMHDAFAAFTAECAVGPVTDELAERFIEAYAAAWVTGITPIDGVPAILEDLRRDGYRLAVVSNTHDPGLVPAQLDRVGIAGAFEAVVTSIAVGRRKPDSAIYAAALAALGVLADDCTFVGDTYRPDYVGPRAAGMDAFLISRPGTSDVPEDRRLDSVLDLPARLRRRGS
jgi:putative hydrolase of the HAD superfamily